MSFVIEGIGSDVWAVEGDRINDSSIELIKEAFSLLKEEDQDLIRDQVVLVSVYTYTRDGSQHMIRFYTENASVGIDVDGEYNGLFYYADEVGLNLNLREYLHFGAWKDVSSNVSLETAYDVFNGIFHSAMHELVLRDIRSAHVEYNSRKIRGNNHECTFVDSAGTKITVEFDDHEFIAVYDVY